MNDSRICILAEQLHMIHPQHPQLGQLLSDKDALLRAARECPTAIHAAEIVLDLPRNRLKQFVFTKFAIEPLCATDQQKLQRFMISFIEGCTAVPDCFAQRCLEYMRITGAAVQYDTLLHHFRVVLSRQEAKELLARRGLRIPPQVRTVEMIAQTAPYEVSATDQTELNRAAQLMDSQTK